jgi:uncharacterized protein YjbI with pentapeptide repeats
MPQQGEPGFPNAVDINYWNPGDLIAFEKIDVSEEKNENTNEKVNYKIKIPIKPQVQLTRDTREMLKVDRGWFLKQLIHLLPSKCLLSLNQACIDFSIKNLEGKSNESEEQTSKSERIVNKRQDLLYRFFYFLRISEVSLQSPPLPWIPLQIGATFLLNEGKSNPSKEIAISTKERLRFYVKDYRAVDDSLRIERIEHELFVGNFRILDFNSDAKIECCLSIKSYEQLRLRFQWLLIPNLIFAYHYIVFDIWFNRIFRSMFYRKLHADQGDPQLKIEKKMESHYIRLATCRIDFDKAHIISEATVSFMLPTVVEKECSLSLKNGKTEDKLFQQFIVNLRHTLSNLFRSEKSGLGSEFEVYLEEDKDGLIREVYLRGINFCESDFNHSSRDFSGSKNEIGHQEIRLIFDKCNFSKANFKDIQIRNIRFSDCDFREANFHGTTLERVNISSCKMPESFVDSCIRNSSVKNCSLHDSCLHYNSYISLIKDIQEADTLSSVRSLQPELTRYLQEEGMSPQELPAENSLEEKGSRTVEDLLTRQLDHADLTPAKDLLQDFSPSIPSSPDYQVPIDNKPYGEGTNSQ